MATSARKTTDLERLTKPGGKVMPDDATIPVLTERLTLPSLDLDISLPKPPPPVVTPPEKSKAAAAKPESPPESVPEEAVKVVRPPATAALPAEPTIDWDTIEAQLRDNLFNDLQPQLTAELERQVRERLQPTLTRALTALVSELRPALDSTVHETIARAIKDEIERQRSSHD